MKRLLRFYRYPKSIVGAHAEWHKGCARASGQSSVAYGLGLLVNWKAFWVGWHYSEHHKRLCVNLIPCVTIWWTKPGGYLP